MFPERCRQLLVTPLRPLVKPPPSVIPAKAGIQGRGEARGMQGAVVCGLPSARSIAARWLGNPLEILPVAIRF